MIKSLLNKKIVGQGLTVLILRFFGLFLAYLMNVLIAKTFGKEIYGNFVTSLTLLEVVGTLACLGLTELIIKITANPNYYSNNKLKKNYLTNSLLVVFIFASFLGVLLFFSHSYIAEFVFKTTELNSFFCAIALFLPFYCLHLLLTSFWQGKNKFTLFGLFRFVIPPAIFLIGFLLIKEQKNILFVYMMSFVITFLLELILANKTIFLNKASKISANILVKSSYPMMLSAIVLFSLNWIDVLMLGILNSQTEVANYQAAFKIASLGLLIIVSINIIISPKISEMYAKRLIDKMFLFLKRVTFYTSIATLIVLLPFIIFPSFTMGVFFGENFKEAGTVLLILCITNIINTSFGAIVEVMNMTQHQKKLHQITLIVVFVNIFLNFIFIKNYGAIGCAIATLITILLLNILVSLFLYKTYNRTFFLFSK